jgi:hypothetical protein
MSERFTPSDLQAKAIREINDWFLHRTDEQQVFRVFGYAGTGKTTITRHAIDELGLDTMDRGRWRRERLGRRAVRRLHRQGGAGNDSQGHARLDHPQPDLPRLGGHA